MTTTTTPARDTLPAIGNTAGREADKPSPPPPGALAWLAFVRAVEALGQMQQERREAK